MGVKADNLYRNSDDSDKDAGDDGMIGQPLCPAKLRQLLCNALAPTRTSSVRFQSETIACGTLVLFCRYSGHVPLYDVREEQGQTGPRTLAWTNWSWTRKQGIRTLKAF